MPILIKGSGSKRDPFLTTGSCSASESSFGTGHWHMVPSGYDGFKTFTVAERSAATTPSGGTAYAKQVRKGKKIYARNTLITGTMEDTTASDITLSKSLNSDGTKLTITASYTPTVGYLSSAVSVTKPDIYVPQSNQYADYECMYFSTPNTTVPTSHRLNIPTTTFDGKSLKYMILVGTSECSQMYIGETCMTSLCVDFSADIGYETFVYGSGELYDIGHRGINGICTSATGITLEVNSDSCILTYTDGTYVCGGYYCMQIYQ